MFSANDPKLIEVIRSQFMFEPSQKAYNFTRETERLKLKGGNGQAVLIDRLLKGKRNGFFIEVKNSKFQKNYTSKMF